MADAREEDDPGYQTPSLPSEWAALTDEELFRLRRKIEHANKWHFETRLGHEMSTRLIQALSRASAAEEAAARRLVSLTWALVLLSVVIAVFTIAVFFKG